MRLKFRTQARTLVSDKRGIQGPRTTTKADWESEPKRRSIGASVYLLSGMSRISVRIARNSLAVSAVPSKLRCSRT
jgi:hypothetical protein